MDSPDTQLPTPKVWIREATFSDGSKVVFSQNDIIVLVGPNNAGKSVALKNIEQQSRVKSKDCVVVTSIELSVEGDQNELVNWLENNSRKNARSPSNPVYSRLGASVAEAQAKSWWSNFRNGLHDLSNFFVCHLTTEARLGAANPAPNIALTRDPLTQPIHYLQINDKIELQVSSYFREAFGEDLVVHRNAGNQVPLHCGDRPTPHEGEDRVSVSYLLELEKLPTLHTQGDGMRSFVGVLLHSLVVDHTVVLIDEPEAFLHPPQARLLSQMIVKEAPNNRQFFVATHSGDFLRGLLDMHSDRVRILRIKREGAQNPVKELDSLGIKKVWGDPILRYSNVLDGLFHNKVVLCESDADCRFYAAVMEAMTNLSAEARREDTMFLHCGGKTRMPVVVDSLHNLDVPIRVVADFDVLNNEFPLKNIVEALGESWDNIRSSWELVRRSIEDKKPELSTIEVSKEIREILESVSEISFPTDAEKKIQSILRRASPWSTAKGVGKAYIPSGDPTIAYNNMCEKLAKCGLFVVPVGELEGFARSVGGHGPKWVNSVLEKNLATDNELEDARAFLRKVLI